MMDAAPEDDRQYLVDLGLLRRAVGGQLVVANPIYREVLPRALARGPHDTLPMIAPTWLKADGSLDADALLDAFLAFWAPARPAAPGQRAITRSSQGLRSGGLLTPGNRPVPPETAVREGKSPPGWGQNPKSCGDSRLKVPALSALLG